MDQQQTEQTAQSLWANLLKNCKEAIDKIKEPYMTRSMKRKFKSAHDDAMLQKDNKSKIIFDELSKLDGMNINTIVNAKTESRDLENAAKIIKEVYLELFGEDMKIEE